MVLGVLALAFTARAFGEGVPAKKAVGLTEAEQEEFLLQGEVVRARGAGKGVTGTTQVTLRKDGLEHYASVQTIDEAKSIKPLGAGTTEIDFRDSFRNNVAAYRIARILSAGGPVGLDRVAVTVERIFERKSASYMWWVDDVLMSEFDRHEKKTDAPDPPAWNRQIWVVRIFDQLIYNYDRNLGNLLIDKSWNIWMIDHSRAFKIFKELKDPGNLGTHCPRALLTALPTLNRENVGAATKGMLSGTQVEGLLARRDYIVKYFEARIAELGEKQVLYDLPPRVSAAQASR
jgi:hypothetical protein